MTALGPAWREHLAERERQNDNPTHCFIHEEIPKKTGSQKDHDWSTREKQPKKIPPLFCPVFFSSDQVIHSSKSSCRHIENNCEHLETSTTYFTPDPQHWQRNRVQSRIPAYRSDWMAGTI